MRWRQFLTPITSLNFEQFNSYMIGEEVDNITIIDVRQPNEYQNGHIPGAILMPLPQLVEKINNIDTHKPTVVYCASGNRSRIAAQVLASKGFEEVINLAGGIRALNSQTAIGGEDMGLMLFNGQENVAQCLSIAYALEGGLREFYETMTHQVTHLDAQNLFGKLAAIEIKHQAQIYSEYIKLTDIADDRDAFEANIVTKYIEGGLTAKEFAQLYQPDWESVLDIASTAMAIEAQALDLYLRASRRSQNEKVRGFLKQIASEEMSHMNQLGKLIESL
jgi:sulfur-carrier protein adenylyltransferase/sulfurtransferase